MRPGGAAAGSPGFDWRPAVAAVLALHRQGKLDQAEPLYRQLLQLLPDHPDLLHFHAVLLHQRGRVEQALAQARRSIELRPKVAAWHNNLGNMLLDGRQIEPAVQAYQRCLELDPDNAEVRSNLGNLLRQCGQLEQAEEMLHAAVERAPAAAEPYASLALVYAAQGRMDAAIDAGTRALERTSGNPRTRRLLGLLYARRGRVDLALQVFREWAADCPDDPQARHHLAAASGEAVPERAAADYVVDLFDRFADSFDARLAHLEYRAPELCAQLVQRRLGEADGRRRVLDAGCGTGWCGPLLRPYAHELIGVDLSGGMLERARARGLYDRLERAELGAWLAGCPPRLDLIVSADTLCYFGALDALLVAARGACRPGGWLVFTVEALADAAAGDWRLLPHGRYAHCRDALLRWLQAAGWQAIELQPVVLRQEAGEPVQGWLASARAA